MCRPISIFPQHVAGFCGVVQAVVSKGNTNKQRYFFINYFHANYLLILCAVQRRLAFYFNQLRMHMMRVRKKRKPTMPRMMLVLLSRCIRHLPVTRLAPMINGTESTGCTSTITAARIRQRMKATEDMFILNVDGKKGAKQRGKGQERGNLWGAKGSLW